MLKQQAIERIRKYGSSRSINPSLHINWLPEHSMCSFVGALIEAEDAKNFEEQTGISKKLVSLVQSVVGVCAVAMPDEAYAEMLHRGPPRYVLPDAMAGDWTSWLEAIEVGSQSVDIFPGFMAWTLRDLLSADHPIAPLSSDTRALISEVADLFAAEAGGQAVSDQQWKDVRKKAVALTDATTGSYGESVRVAAIASFLEAVCWSWGGDYVEPLQSLRSFAHAVTDQLAANLTSESDREIIAGHRQAMEQYVVEAKKDKNFDAHVFMANSAGMKRYWSLDFQRALSSQKLKVTPLVGGRMMVGLLECIKRGQIN